MTARFIAVVLGVPAVVAVAAVLALVLLTDGDAGSDPRPAPFREVVYESIDVAPVSLPDALEMIRRDEVFMILLQPDTYSSGAERWYRYTDDTGRSQWKVNGIDVLLYADFLESGLAIATSETSVGVTEEELQTVYETIRSAGLASRIQVRDDREWWANGKPLPHEGVIVELDAGSP